MMHSLVAFLLLLLLQQTIAQDCPPGSPRRNNRCEPCPPGTFDYGFSSFCHPCPQGTFNPSFGAPSADACKPCPAGTFSDSRRPDIGSASCTPCPPGTFSIPGARICLKCPEGSFARNNGSVTCTACAGRRLSRPGYKRCLKGCPPGSALAPRKATCAKCRPGTFRPLHAPPTKCLLCPPGTTSKKGAERCSKCPKGTFRKILVQHSGIPTLSAKCTPCGRNTFADVTGLETCKLCPLGTVAELGAEECTSCPAGTFRSKMEIFLDGTCIPCPNGTISLGRMPAGCKHPERGCPVNTFEDSNGECRACMPGERLDVEEKRCVPCRRNQISLGGVSTVCNTCPRGQRPTDSLTKFEKARCECLPGTVSNNAGGCRICPPGTRWLRRSTRNGREPFFLEASCDTCPSGTFQDEPGMTQCRPCPFGTYTSFFNFTSCIPCPAGTTNDPGDPDAIDKSFRRSDCFSKRDGCTLGYEYDVIEGCELTSCPPGTLPSVNGDICGSCFKDTFLNGTRCITCPMGQASAGGLVTECTVCPKRAEAPGDGTCVCVGRFEDDGRGGCKRCAKGQISIAGKCGSCPEGTIPRVTRFGTFCDRCNGDKVRPPGKRRCRKCPNGFVRDEDVFGLPVNRCVPADGFPV